MNKKAQKLIQIDDKTLKCILLYKKYNSLLKQAIVDKEDLSSEYYKTISGRVDKLVKFLDKYILYKN